MHVRITWRVNNSSDFWVCLLLQIAREHGIRILETSAKINVNIEQAFQTLAEDILKKQLSKDSEEPTSNIQVGDAKERRGGCCWRCCT